MSESPGWAAPGTPPPGGGGPHDEQRVALTKQPPGGAPGGADGGGPGSPGGWGQPQHPGTGPWSARAPRPGIVPLRPLSLGELWDGAFQAVRTNPGPLLGGAAVVVVLTTLLQVLVPLLLGNQFFTSLQTAGADPTASPDDVFSDLGSSLPGLLGGSLLAGVLSLVATAALSGVITVSVSTAVLGRRTAARDLWRRVRARLWPLVGVSLVTALVPGLAVAVVLVPGIAVLVGAALDGSGGAVAAGVLLLVGGGLLALALGLFLSTRLFLAPAVLMLEGQGVGRSLARAWGLSRRGFWRLLGIWLLTAVCIAIVAQVVSVPFSILGQVVGAVVGADSSLYLPVLLGVTGVGTALAGTVLYPLQGAVTALQYVDQRMRLEGLDLELARAAAQ